MKATFYISLALVFYTFIGYGIVLFLIVKLKRLFKGNVVQLPANDTTLPTCTVVVAAYNEQDIIREKVINTLNLDYPVDKIKYIFVTDGSTDNTAAIISLFPAVKLFHETARNGKIAAVHRAIEQVKSEVIVFTDANTFLNRGALKEICKHYTNSKVGAVAGEKRVSAAEDADATAGEGIYWKYESKLKKWDSELYSVVGAAGELFSIRTDLYEPVPANSVLDDFMISMLIAKKGYQIVYEPAAYATETSSANIAEELKRKIRIAAGGIQSIIWLKSLFNPLKLPVLSFEYISHRVLRWTIVPFLLIILFVSNIFLAFANGGIFFLVMLVLQAVFYAASVAGWIMESRQTRIKALFVPYYFCMMNYAVIAGIVRYFNGGQSAIWEKAQRRTHGEFITTNT